jgi:IS5 family transposase
VSDARAPGGQSALGVRALPGSPCDGHTPAAPIAQAERLAGERVERVHVDRGCRGHDAGPARVFIARQRRDGLTPTIRRELRRRDAAEPVIGHLKSDGLLERSRLAGAAGDAGDAGAAGAAGAATNAVLAAAGHDLRLLLAWLGLLCAGILAALQRPLRGGGMRGTAAARPAAPRHAIG